jgi:TolB protein
MIVQWIRRTFLGIVVAMIGVAVISLSVAAQDGDTRGPVMVEFGTDAFVRILLAECPECANGDVAAALDDPAVILVSFVGGTAEQRAEIEQIAARWEEQSSVDFQFGEFENADVRLVFDADAMGPADAIDSMVTALVATGDSSRLNIRSGPSTDYPIIGKGYNGSRYTVIARTAAGDWLQILAPELASQRGWVSAGFVDVSGNLFAMPPVAVPAARIGADAQSGSDSLTRGSAGRPPVSLSGKIVLPLWDEGSEVYSIYSVNADGSNLRKIVENASSPALSPDGAQLAYRDWARDNRGIVVSNADGSAPLRLTAFLEDVLPSWSADGKRITFSSYRESDRKSRIYYLWADREIDWVLKRGQEAVYGEDPYWMADGRIAYTLHTGRPVDQLLTMNGDGSKPEVLIDDPTVRSPAASPDGRFIAFMSMRNGNWDLYRLNVDGSGLIQLTDQTDNDGLPTWSPDGESIAFVSDRGGFWGLWVMNTDGSNSRLITALPGSVDGIVRDEQDYLTNGWLEEQISWSR